MNKTPEPFEDLVTLLSAKRHEQPPPVFFTRLSSQVRERIASTPPPPPPTFWDKVTSALELRPVLILAYGAILCGGVGFGMRIASAMHLQPQPLPSVPLTADVESLRAYAGAAGSNTTTQYFGNLSPLAAENSPLPYVVHRASVEAQKVKVPIDVY